jgi:capsular polysaccharide synthesis protein
VEKGVNLPRTIWFTWFQGLDNAPYVVRRCYESWVNRNPGWRVVSLDAANLREFTSVDYSRGNIANLSLQHQAGLLRLDLLSHHGGVWADATCFCVQPLDEWLPEKMGSGFFAFHRPGPDRIISSWFLGAEAENVLVTRLFNQMLAYWRDHPLRTDERQLIAKLLTRLLRNSSVTRGWWFSRPIMDWLKVGPYFAISYGLEHLIREDPECAQLWQRMPRLNADGPHRLYNAGLLSPVSPELRSEIDSREVPVYKTTWRTGNGSIPSNSILEYLLEVGPHIDEVPRS